MPGAYFLEPFASPLDGTVSVAFTDAPSADFDKVWNEGSILEIREAISKGEVHPFCAACIGLGRYQHSSVELENIGRHLEISTDVVAAH